MALAIRSRGTARVALDRGEGHVLLAIEDATEQSARNRGADAFAALAAKPLGEPELADLRARLVGDWAVRLSGGPALAAWLAELSASGVDLGSSVAQRWRSALEAVTAEELQAFAAEQLTDPVQVVIAPGAKR